MQATHFDQFNDDTTILAIGSLFKKDKTTTWGINLDLAPKAAINSLRLSQLPVLARKRVLNATKEYKPAGFHLSFTIDSTAYWQSKKLGDYPVSSAIRTMDRRQHCFYFKTNNIDIYVPQLELARVLFLRNGYLSRSAPESDYLKNEFSIENVSLELARVNVLPSSSYTLESLDDDESRRILGWILIDPDARSSYESISHFQKINGYAKGGYRQWEFEFNPPLLPFSSFEVRGRFDRQTNSMLVYEIVGIRNIQATVPNEIEFFHPNLREYVHGEGDGAVRLVPERPSVHSVQDGVDANADTTPVLLRAPAVIIEFSKAFNTRKVAEKKQEGTNGKTDESVGSKASENVSTEESIIGGDLPSAEWTSEADEARDLHLYANKFDCFQLMLDELVSMHGCVIKSKQLRKLPKLYRCNRHLLLDGSPRCLAIVELELNNRLFQILEVDTSDGICSISTMLLELTTKEKWHENLKLLCDELTQKSLHWPSNRLSALCGKKGYSGIPHPQTKSVDKGKLPESSITHWAARFHSWMAGVKK